MPEAAIDEDCQPGARKHNIHADPLDAKPDTVAQSTRPETTPDRALGLGVTLPDSRHEFGPGRRSYPLHSCSPWRIRHATIGPTKDRENPAAGVYYHTDLAGVAALPARQCRSHRPRPRARVHRGAAAGSAATEHSAPGIGTNEGHAASVDAGRHRTCGSRRGQHEHVPDTRQARFMAEYRAHE